MIPHFPDMLQTRSVPFASLSLPDAEVCRYMGYGEHEPDPRILSMLTEMKRELVAVCRPEFGFKTATGTIDGGQTLLLEERPMHPGRIIVHCLRGSESFFLLVATAGHAYDSWRHGVEHSGDMVRLLVADSLGSAIVEAVVARALEELEALVSPRGMHVSNSYSPGYCGWDVAEQKILFGMLPPRFCGISLTESCLMVPVKSVSCVVGMGRKLKKQPYGCAICRKKDCYKRRDANHAHSTPIQTP